jgi:hypothetical protein
MAFIPVQTALKRGAARTPGAGLDGKRSPEGESAGDAERAEGMDARSERPATGYGQSRSRPKQPEANVRQRRTGSPEARHGKRPRSLAPRARPRYRPAAFPGGFPGPARPPSGLIREPRR